MDSMVDARGYGSLQLIHDTHVKHKCTSVNERGVSLSESVERNLASTDKSDHAYLNYKSSHTLDDRCSDDLSVAYGCPDQCWTSYWHSLSLLL